MVPDFIVYAEEIPLEHHFLGDSNQEQSSF